MIVQKTEILQNLGHSNMSIKTQYAWTVLTTMVLLYTARLDNSN